MKFVSRQAVVIKKIAVGELFCNSGTAITSNKMETISPSPSLDDDWSIPLGHSKRITPFGEHPTTNLSQILSLSSEAASASLALKGAVRSGKRTPQRPKIDELQSQSLFPFSNSKPIKSGPTGLKRKTSDDQLLKRHRGNWKKAQHAPRFSRYVGTEEVNCSRMRQKALLKPAPKTKAELLVSLCFEIV